MPRAISLKILNKFVEYPYLVLGWGAWTNTSYPTHIRQYSMYKMLRDDLVELIPLPPTLIEDISMPDGQSTRCLYQNCIYSEEWVSPFEKGCVKSIREVVQALEAMGLLLPEYWEVNSSGGKGRNINRTLLQSTSLCAYNLLSVDYRIKRGNKIMAAKSNGAVAVAETEDTEEKPKRRSGPTVMNAVYSEMTRAEEVSLQGLKIIYDYLERACGSTRDGVELLTLFDKHINSKKTTYSGMAEPATVSEFIAHLRNWNTPEEAVQLMTAGILEEAQNSFDLESALTQIKTSTEAKKTK